MAIGVKVEGIIIDIDDGRGEGAIEDGEEGHDTIYASLYSSNTMLKGQR